MAGQADDREQLAYYGRSWLLVHYLVDYELQGFLNFLVRFRNGEDWQTAWDKEILVRWDGIDDALDRYYDRATYGLWRVEAHLPDLEALETSAVPPSEALALRAVLLASSTNPERERSESFQAANRDLETACDLDPDSARVRVISEALAATQQP